ELMAHGPGGADLGYAVARIAVYRDGNSNLRRDPGEPLVGIDAPAAYLYAPAPLPAGRAPTNGALPAGFSAVLLPQSCGDPPPGPTTPGDCGVPLGARCRGDADCGPDGSCLDQTNLAWPVGYCVVLEPPRAGCRPGDGVFYHRPMFAPRLSSDWAAWLKACRSDDDCTRRGLDLG